ncbi:50S ribosome-binding GTPase [Cellulosimicrobium cellulans]|uniref:GTPase n=1 Tax=Cellulosimicrobium cellulans TaxID=1710 RepID=UPI001EDC8E3F|nr:GTPase [Cellulosimicrobium cellulans]UKJ64366.1 50S ribosome-binding GTPase [Cellulosimicrobium cellulans]
MRTPDAATSDASPTAPGRSPGSWRPAQATEELGVTVYDVARDLRRDVADVRLPLAIDGAAESDASRRRLLTQLDEHLLPRLRELSSPAIVVIAGSTGAGKSTLYNSLLGEEVSQAGVLRPTTREPVLAFNPLDADVVVEGPVTRVARVIDHDGVPRGTGLLDAPDLDSLLSENRDTASLLLEAADLWLFVTTASRYGDALPWQALSRAKERGASVAMVLNRVPRETLTTIRGDLLQRLRDHGMDGTPLFVVPDVGPHEGLLDRSVVAPVARWLTMLAGPDRSRAVIVRTLKGALGALPAWVTGVSDAVEQQVEAAADLRSAAEKAVPAVRDAARQAALDGAVAHGSLEARWAQVTGAERVDRVKVRGGVVRSSKRRGRARDLVLAPLLEETRDAAHRTLAANGVLAHDALRAALDGDRLLPGATDVLPTEEDAAARREASATTQVLQWSRRAEQVVAELAAPTASEPARAAVKAFGETGLAALLLAGAAGSEDAARLVRTVLADTGDDALAALRDDLADRAATMVEREVEPVLTALADPALAADAAVGLRLRLAELRRLM